MLSVAEHAPNQDLTKSGGENKTCLQVCLDVSISFSTYIEPEPPSNCISSAPQDTDDPNSHTIIRSDGTMATHLQTHLSGFRSVIDAMFEIDELLNEKHLSEAEIMDYLWNPFPLYNLNDVRMIEFFNHVLEIFKGKEKIIIPSKLLGLAALNAIDKHVSKKNTSNYFKAKILKGMSSGHRSYAIRILKDGEYVEEFGNCWCRTGKKFDQHDFWLESKRK